MRYINKGLTFLLSVTIATLVFGCANLDPNGVYGKLGAAGQWIYATDVAVDQSYNVIDAGLLWEVQNYTYLETNSPTTVTLFNTVRTKVPKYFADYSKVSVLFKASVGTVQEAAASNAVVTASTAISNVTAAVSQVVTNVPGTTPAPAPSTVSKINLPVK